jgi:hypothetical protein
MVFEEDADPTSLWLDGARADEAMLARIDAGVVSGIGPRAALAPQEAVDLADRLASVHAASGGCDGFVAIAPSAAVAVLAGGTPNLLVTLPFGAAGLHDAEELVSRGVPVAIGPVLSVAEYALAAERYQAGLRRRLAAGAPVARQAALTWTPVGAIDAYAGPRLAVAARRGELTPMVGDALAQLIYVERFRAFSGLAWRRLRAAGAWPLRCAFCDLPAESLARLALPGAVLSLAAPTLLGLDTTALPAAEPDETEARWMLRAAERHGLDLGAMRRALRRRPRPRAAARAAQAAPRR